jgi:chemotaxis signal transduction protein
MKLAKCLIFKVDNQFFAIRTKMVFNIIEKPKMVSKESNQSFENAMFSFRGMLIPLLDIRKILGLAKESECPNKFVLIVELKINGYPELVGIPIDEVTEVKELDDLLSYPYCSVTHEQQSNLRETIIMHNDIPVIMLNTGKNFSERVLQYEMEQPIFHMAN